MKINTTDAAHFLQQADNILILSHHFPDGDTLGSAYGLAMALLKLGKQVRVECSDPIPSKYSYFTSIPNFPEFEPECVVAVDIADPQLFGAKLQHWAQRVDLCIDHHASNSHYAARLLLEETGATAEIIWQVIGAMGVEPDFDIAQAIYTGITTDTGCFRYSNTTAQTHRIAAELMELGVEAARINRIMFEVKTRARFEMERAALDSVEYYFDGSCAVMYITQEMIKATGAKDGDLEGLPPLTRQIEGVKIGVTIREKADGSYKVSLRTGASFDASAICGMLGGGGHARAAGCTLGGTREEARDTVLAAVEKVMGAAR